VSIASDVQSATPGAIIDLYELDASAVGGGLTRYHPGRNANMRPIVWQGNTYTPFPVEATGFELNVRGTLPRPTIRFANINGFIGSLVHQYDDLVGAKITRKRTLAKYLDAANAIAYSATAAAGGTTTLQLPGDAASNDDAYVGMTIKLVSGAGSVQSGLVIDYDGASRTATVGPRWATNMCRYAEALTPGAVWTAIGTPVVTAASMITAAGVTLDGVQDDAAGAYEGVTQDMTGLPNDTASYVVSIYVAKTSGGTAPTFGMNVYLVNGSVNPYINLRINTDTGAELNGEANVVVQTLSDCWRVSVVIANNGLGNTILRIGLYPAVGPHAWTIDTLTATGSAQFGGLQAERANSLGTYIRTVESAVALPNASTACEVWAPSVLTPDPNAHWPDETWYIDRKASENKVYIEFELTAPWDVQGVTLPRRKIIQNVCPWKYRSAECGYTGNAVAKLDDTPTSNLAEDNCGRRITSCKLRNWPNDELPFGGFPGCGLT